MHVLPITRSMLYSGTWTMRLTHMHRYLFANLKPYSTDCCAVYPSEKLSLAPTSESEGEIDLVNKTYEANLATPSDTDTLIQFQIDSQITDGKMIDTLWHSTSI